MKMRMWSIVGMGLLYTVSSAGRREAALNSGDTAWMIVSTALVMMNDAGRAWRASSYGGNVALTRDLAEYPCL